MNHQSLVLCKICLVFGMGVNFQMFSYLLPAINVLFCFLKHILLSWNLLKNSDVYISEVHSEAPD